MIVCLFIKWHAPERNPDWDVEEHVVEEHAGYHKPTKGKAYYSCASWQEASQSR